MKQDNVPSFINKKFPKADIKFIGSGSDSDAYKIGNHIIRIPHANSTELYLREAAICSAISQYVSFQIPNISVHKEKDGTLWAEHEMIMGEKWSWHKYMWHPKRMHNLGRSLARFMAELHSVDIRKIPTKYRESVPYMSFNTVAPFLAKFLNDNQMQFFKKHYEKILAYPVKKSDMVLVHLGIKGPNSVADKDGNLVGVFDFCNAGIYERERDMVLIAIMAPNSLWRIFAREYKRLTGINPNKKRIIDLAKIEFLWAKRWIRDDGQIQPAGNRFMLKNIGAAMAHFHHLPYQFKWWWYYAIKLKRHI